MTLTKNLLNKSIPFLNEYLPMDTAKKGLEKLDKSFIKYFAEGTAAGYGVKELMNVLRDKFTPLGQQLQDEKLQKRVKSGKARPEEVKLSERGRQSRIESGLAGTALAAIPAVGAARAGGAALGAGAEMLGATALEAGEEMMGAGQPQEPTSEELPGQPQPGQEAPQAGPQDLFRQNPELFTFVDQIIKQGKPPSFAAQRAMRDRRFAQLIPQIEQTAQMDFTSLLEQMYGGGQGGQRQQEQQLQPGQPGFLWSQRGEPQQPQQGQPQGGGVREQFLQGLQKSDATLNAILQSLKGK